MSEKVLDKVISTTCNVLHRLELTFLKMCSGCSEFPFILEALLDVGSYSRLPRPLGNLPRLLVLSESAGFTPKLGSVTNEHLYTSIVAVLSCYDERSLQ